MIDQVIKNKIKNGILISNDELITYLEKLIPKKKKRYNVKAICTAKYILVNFEKVLSTMDLYTLTTLLRKTTATKLEPYILKALNNSIDSLILMINKSDSKDVWYFQIHLIGLLDTELLFRGKFFEFYTKIDKDKFDIEMLINNSSNNFKDKMQKEYMQTFFNALETGKLAPQHIYFFIQQLKMFQEGLKFLEKNAEKLLEITNSPMKTFLLLKETNVNMNKIKKIINSRIDDVIKEMLKQNQDDSLKSEDTKIQEAKIQETIKMLLQDLLKEENCQVSDIVKIGNGSYSSVFQVGTKVIKLGTVEQYIIPKNSKRFLQPIVRYNHEFYKDGRQYTPITIVISEICDISLPASINELYEIYKDIRKDGMIWTDVKQENVGRLIKDNHIHYNGIENVYGPNLGFKEDNKVKILRKR